ncbi:hypothetical protein [Nocardia nova]|nr:hypothetical protein [Nocardia nova]
MPEIYAIVDRVLGSRLTFGPDDNPTYYIGTMLDGYIATTNTITLSWSTATPRRWEPGHLGTRLRPAP